MKILNYAQRGIILSLLALVLASASWAGLEDQVSAYSESNAKGYLEPLVEAAGTDLSLGLFGSAYIPPSGYYLRLELKAMGTWFSDDDRTFRAVTEEGFQPKKSAKVPTVVGPGKAVGVEGDRGNEFLFPGGFDLNSLALATPQIRVGSFRGTEVLFRGVGGVFGDNELGNISLFGFGFRHSISQYLAPEFPVHLAGGFMWQRFKTGENEAGEEMFRTTAWTLGLEGSRIYERGPAAVEPYLGLSLDSYSSEVAYESKASGEAGDIAVSFDPTYMFRLSLGFLVRLKYVAGQAEFNMGKRRSMTFGLGFGMY